MMAKKHVKVTFSMLIIVQSILISVDTKILMEVSANRLQPVISFVKNDHAEFIKTRQAVDSIRS